jgi:hypothetical protein
MRAANVLGLVLGLSLGLGCVRNRVSPQPPTVDAKTYDAAPVRSGAVLCAADLGIPTACVNRFTPGGVPCVLCPGNGPGHSSCYWGAAGVWCVAGNNCDSDPKCVEVSR